VEVDLRRLYRFVAKPERNHRKVDSSPQEIPIAAVVAKRMRRDQSAHERGAVSSTFQKSIWRARKVALSDPSTPTSGHLKREPMLVFLTHGGKPTMSPRGWAGLRAREELASAAERTRGAAFFPI